MAGEFEHDDDEIILTWDEYFDAMYGDQVEDEESEFDPVDDDDDGDWMSEEEYLEEEFNRYHIGRRDAYDF